MPPLTPTLCLVALAYFCGSLPFGYWAGRLKGIDIRQHGSGNIGATNVIRVLGKGIGLPVFALDALKGFLPTFLASWWMRHHAGAEENTASLVAVLCAAASVLGHMFTPWLGFKGGKGVATTAGAMGGLAPMVLLIAIVVWVVFLYTTRYVALASMMAGFTLPTASAFLMPKNYVLIIFGIAVALLVVVRHRGNIARMIAGTESRIKSKKK